MDKEKSFRRDYCNYNEEAFNPVNLDPLTGLVYYIDYQILLKCLISFIRK